MVLDHERFDVYLVALEFLVFANESSSGCRAGEGIWQTRSHKLAMSFEDARPAPEESGV